MSSAPLASAVQSAWRCCSPAQGRSDLEGGAPHGVVQGVLAEHQVRQTGLAEGGLPTALRSGDLAHRVRGGHVVDQRARAGDTRHREGAVDGLALHLGRTRPCGGMPPAAAGEGVLAKQLADDDVVLGVDDHEAAEAGHLLHRHEDHVVREPVGVVGHVQLEARHAAHSPVARTR